MARRGFFAELQHQAKLAARERERAQRDLERQQRAAARRVEQAQRANERARAQYLRATAAENKRLEKEAKAAHIAAMEAEVQSRNSCLANQYDEIDSLLMATLGVDDYVDLETLRAVVEHPPFEPGDLARETPKPPTISDPPEPLFIEPPPATGIAALFGKKKRVAELAEAAAKHERALAAWRDELDEIAREREQAAAAHASDEARRKAALVASRAQYAAECAARDVEVEEQNRELDSLIANLGYGAVDAVQEYVSIVLSNSVYPSHFPVGHEFTFDATTAELRLRVSVPTPERVPSIKEYKYKKASDEITSTALSQKAAKDRYASAVQMVALRSLHEIFEADRRGLIKTISLEVGTETTEPATGLVAYIPFVAVGAERESFLVLNLANVVPAATLDHLGASVSKSPLDLVATDTTGIRRS